MRVALLAALLATLTSTPALSAPADAGVAAGRDGSVPPGGADAGAGDGVASRAGDGRVTDTDGASPAPAAAAAATATANGAATANATATAPPPTSGAGPRVLLRGRTLEMGTRRPLAGVAITVDAV